MTALRCFDAAVRTGSFTRAGVLLGLSQSAVSRQIATLEATLGLKLFQRAGPYVQLTNRGRGYADAIGPALAAIEAATERFRSALDQGVISLATLPSFGMRWLAPRLSGLTAALPELVVNLFARSDEFDFATEVHDAAIHFGSPSWLGACCDLLFDERCLAVVAPRLVAMSDGDTEHLLSSVPRLTLVNRPGAWTEWATAAGSAFVDERPAARYEHFAMLIQATAAGAGAALIPEYLIADELASGKLVAVSPMPLVSDGAYYLVYPAEKLEKSAFRKFRNWLLNEAHGDG
jgi:LysR family glycine cleavage system transcriptional activator